jgi:hypothetical protein
VQDALEIKLSSRIDAPSQARAFTERFAAGYDLECRSNLALVVSELVTRTVVDGAGDTILLRLGNPHDGVVRGEILGGGAGFESLLGTPEGKVSARIIAQLTVDWGLDERGGAWFEMTASSEAA